MIQINLLPKELRKKKKIEIPHIDFLPIICGVLGIVVIVHLFLSLSVGVKARALGRLEAEWKELRPKKEDADKVALELTSMRSRIEAIDALIRERMSWAKKLNDLSDAIIPGVWLNRLWLEKKVEYEKAQGPKSGAGAAAETKKITVETLHLNGSVIASGGVEAAAIGNFMRSLKGNQSFFEGFGEIETAYMQQTKLEDIEAMDFELICYFK